MSDKTNWFSSLIDSIMGFAADLGAKFASRLVESKQHQDLIDKVGKEVIQRFGDKAFAFLTVEKLIKIAEDTQENNGFVFMKKMGEALEESEIDEHLCNKEKQELINFFLECLIQEIKETKPDLYLQIKLNQVFDSLTESKFFEKSNETNSFAKSLWTKETQIYDFEEICKDLESQTINPTLTLDFFKSDDEQFPIAINNCIQSKITSIYIIGDTFEETFYATLNALKQLGLQNRILVAKTKPGWDVLINKNDPNLIILPFFKTKDELFAAKSGISIFVCTDAPLNKNGTIQFHRRAEKAVVDLLGQMGADSNKINQLIDKTNGRYLPLKRLLINGKNNLPEILEKPSKAFIAAVLCGEWTYSGGDISLITALSGCQNYDDFYSEIEPLINGEDPMFIEMNKDNSGHKIKVIDQEDDWITIRKRLTSQQAFSFVSKITTIVTDFSIDEVATKRNLIKTKKYSDVLKAGILKTAIFISRDDEKHRGSIDSVIHEIYQSMKTVEDSDNLSEIFPYLLEASPVETVKLLTTSMENGSSFMDMLSSGAMKGDIIPMSLSSIYLQNIFELVSDPEQSADVIQWVAQLNEKHFAYEHSVSPREILEEAFCPWANVAGLSSDQLLELAGQLLPLFPDFWYVLSSEVTHNDSLILFSHHYFYREVIRKLPVTIEDYHFRISKFANLCLDSIGTDINRCQSIIDFLDKKTLSDAIKDKTLSALSSLMAEAKDSGKQKIDFSLREFVYKHRFFADNPSWKIDSTLLQKIETLISNIPYQQKEYHFLYLLGLDFPITNPVVSSQANWMDENDKSREKTLREEFLSLKKDKLLVALLDIAPKDSSTTIGKSLFLYYDMKFNSQTFKLIIDKGYDKKQIIDYVWQCYQNDKNSYYTAVKQIKDSIRSEELLPFALFAEKITSDKTQPIFNQSESVKKTFWTNLSINSISYDRDSYKIALEEILNYGDINSLVNVLFHSIGTEKHFFSPQETLNYLLIAYKKWPNLGIALQDNFMMSCVIDYLNSISSTDLEYLNGVSLFEVLYSSCLESKKMLASKAVLSRDPRSYALLLSMLFLKDDEEKKESSDQTNKVQERLFDFYWNIKFCPGEVNGTIDPKIFNSWIEGFMEAMAKQKQTKVCPIEIGRCLSMDPEIIKGNIPSQIVCETIEKNKDNQPLIRNFETGIYNLKDTYSSYQEPATWSKQCKEKAETLKIKYPTVSKVFLNLFEEYKLQAKQVRQKQEDE